MSERTPSMDLARIDISRRLLLAIGVLIALFGIGFNPATASAHTGFESSTPAEGASIDQPVEIVTIVFTGEATPVGDEFIALTPDGVVQEPASVATVDDMIFSIRFDPPLAGGQIGIRWNVKAADAHPIEGAFAFTVNAPAITTTTTLEADPTVIVDEGATGATESVGPTAQTLDEFLIVDESTPGETTATIGRLLGFLGVALGLGAFAFLATALRGRRDEVRHTLTAVRVLGIVIAVGAAVEYVGVARIGSDSLTAGWSTGPGFATVLRMVGGVGLAVGVGGTMQRGRVQRLMRRPSVVRSLSSAVIDDISTRPAHGDEGPIVRWMPDARSWPALAGSALMIASFWFDGHTVSKGFRPLHALVNSVHVAAGAIWVGGVVTMAAIIWSRHRSHHPMRVVELVVRFSKVATIALASVVVAGALMAFLVLDSFGELTGTPWGKILLLKTAAVGLTMIGGAYNHFRLLPALDVDPESPELLSELRSTVTAEAIMLLFVVTVTVWLVAAAS